MQTTFKTQSYDHARKMNYAACTRFECGKPIRYREYANGLITNETGKIVEVNE